MVTPVTIPKGLTHGDELVVVRRKEYEQLKKHLLEVKDTLNKINRGEKELNEKKTRVTAKSLTELYK